MSALLVITFQRSQGMVGAIRAFAECEIVRLALVAHNVGGGSFFMLALKIFCPGDQFQIVFVCRAKGLCRERLNAALNVLESPLRRETLLFVVGKRLIARTLWPTGAHNGDHVIAQIEAGVDLHCRLDQLTHGRITLQARTETLDTCARLLAVPLQANWAQMVDALVEAHRPAAHAGAGAT
jgi:hypothetical protein